MLSQRFHGLPLVAHFSTQNLVSRLLAAARERLGNGPCPAPGTRNRVVADPPLRARSVRGDRPLGPVYSRRGQAGRPPSNAPTSRGAYSPRSTSHRRALIGASVSALWPMFRVVRAEPSAAQLYSPSMKFGLFAINFGSCSDPEAAVRVALHAEAAGFESVWTGEHVVLPEPAATRSLPPSLPMLDTIVSLTLVATHTSSIKVGSGIIVLPLRNPVVLAKELASVDVVSNGRLVVGVGAGYIPAEFEAVGVPITERGGRMDDYIDAMRALCQ